MKSLFLFFLFAINLAAFAQPGGTIAVLDFENSAQLKDVTIRRLSDRIRQEFTSRGSDYVILDPWLVDTMMSAQGNKQLLKCTDESCLFAVGHLLSVDVVVSGTITMQDQRYCIACEIIDIKNNTSSGFTRGFVKDFQENTMNSASRGLVSKLIELRNSKMPAVQGSNQNRNTSAQSLGASEQEKPSNAKANNSPKKSGIKRGLIWTPVAVAVLGAAAAGIYFFGVKHAAINGPANSDISLDDAPKHPGGARDDPLAP